MYGGCLLCPLYPLLVTPDAFIEKIWGAEICIKFEREEFSITGEYCSKTDSKVEDLGRGTVVCVARRRRDLKAKDCQQGEEKRSYRAFVTVVISIIIIVFLLVLFGRVVVFILVFALRVIASHVKIY